MAENTTAKKPLSLNERHQLLLQGLSRSRTSKPNTDNSTETKNRDVKVQIQGRRRLCKIQSTSDEDETKNNDFNNLDDLADSPEKKSENILDIMDDLSSRLGSLSVEKPKAKPRAPVNIPETLSEFKSASSSLSPSSDEKGKDVVSDDCVVLDDDDKEDEYKDRVVVNDNNEEAKEVDDKNKEDIVINWIGNTNTRKKYMLPGNTAKMLYPHQRDGLQWFWTLHCAGTGGILGDDMGLGKTMQVAAFLSGLFHSRLIMRVMIVAPKTLIAHWVKELSVVGLSNKIRDYSGASQKVRDHELQYTFQDGGILLTTYDIVRNNYKSLRGNHYQDLYANINEEDNLWDYIVLDEGHIIKNPKTQRAQALFEIPCAHRVIISGTPIQNNLKELWALFYFCCPSVLGDKDEFKYKYESKILRGNDKHATNREKYVGSTLAKELRERIKPYFLRRLKSEVFGEDDSTNVKLSKKNELIVWLRLTKSQRQLYEAFLKSDWVHSSLDGGSPLAALTILKKICDHPLLLTKKAAEGVLEGMDSMLNHEELGLVEEMAKKLANNNSNELQQLDHNESCKICFIMTLLDNLIAEGHTVLIFSQTRKMLNLIQEAIIAAGYRFLRIDGTTKIADRESIVKDFQEGRGAPIFLLTSQVGGLGLTLTKADRVIVVDPAWNPSTDNQSVDRAYRIGQEKDVIVYRLMTCGTIEEKIYKMQVFKGGLFRTATEHKEQTRYFSQKDMHEVFSLPEQGFDISITQQQLHEEHGQQQDMEPSLESHIEFLERQGIAGVSHHSLLFSKNATVSYVPDDTEQPSKTTNVMHRNYNAGSSTELAVDGAKFAVKPKEFISREYKPKHDDENSSPESIRDKIRRLSETLANESLILRLPDQGAKIKAQIAELNAKLDALKYASKLKENEVIDVDGLTKDFGDVISV